MMNIINITRRLIQFPSVTPADEKIMEYLISVLEPLGFTCHRLSFKDKHDKIIHNLYARRGEKSPHLCFAGHVDVVPVGEEVSWVNPPFEGKIHDNAIWGRGAADMKGAIAAFISAASNPNHPGSISLLLTGDEEGSATHGTLKVIEWLEERKEKIDFCIVGEPTSEEALGDTIKIGRRGSLNGSLKIKGVQGHVAYPHKADNPIPKMIQLLKVLDDRVLDEGYENFQPSNLEITSIDVGNTTSNIIPELITASFNIRFNPTYTTLSLKQHLRTILQDQNIVYKLDFNEGSDPFMTEDHPAIQQMVQSIESIKNFTPKLSTSGGTSDARFIRKIAPVIEVGLLNETAHKVDEHVSLNDLEALSRIYKRFIDLYFQTTS